MTVTYKQYSEERGNFFKNHEYDYKVETSMMDEYGRYTKTYIFDDGATWYELMSPEFVTETIEIKLVNVKVEVKMLKTEYWSSESGSKYYYEKF